MQSQAHIPLPTIPSNQYIFSKPNRIEIRVKVAIQFTAEHRGSEEAIKEWKEVLKELEDDETMKNQWKRYQKNNFYAEGIEYEDLMKSIKEVGEVYDSEQ